jgi:hypothetical protein
MASPAKQLRRKTAVERLENTIVQHQASLKEEKDQDAVKVLKKKIAGHEFTIANTKAALKAGEHTSFNTSNFFKD